MNGTRRVVRAVRRAGANLAVVVVALVAPSLGAATIRGRITKCSGSVGAPGHVVKAFEELKIGLRDLAKPCTIVTQNAQLVGTATARADGSYSITYTPTEAEPELCFFERKVFIRVFLPDGTTLIHASARKSVSSTVAFSFDTGDTTNCPQVLVPAFLELVPPSIVAGGPPTNARVSFTNTGGSGA
ncbi:MAG: hypothetical protein HY721_26075, partial [Planctomycetes bacterium]|nr:hypothetical protein [Planctomycetota bacterium]